MVKIHWQPSSDAPEPNFLSNQGIIKLSSAAPSQLMGGNSGDYKGILKLVMRLL